MDASQMCQDEKVFAVAVANNDKNQKEWYLYYIDENQTAQLEKLNGQLAIEDYKNFSPYIREKFKKITEIKYNDNPQINEGFSWLSAAHIENKCLSNKQFQSTNNEQFKLLSCNKLPPAYKLIELKFFEQ